MVELSIKMMRIGIEDSGEDDTVGYIKGEEEGDGQVWKEERDVKEVMMISGYQERSNSELSERTYPLRDISTRGLCIDLHSAQSTYTPDFPSTYKSNDAADPGTPPLPSLSSSLLSETSIGFAELSTSSPTELESDWVEIVKPSSTDNLPSQSFDSLPTLTSLYVVDSDWSSDLHSPLLNAKRNRSVDAFVDYAEAEELEVAMPDEEEDREPLPIDAVCPWAPKTKHTALFEDEGQDEDWEEFY